MSKQVLSQLQNIWLNEHDIIQKVKKTIKLIRINTNNLSILKYLYKNYHLYPKEFLIYLFMTMEENAITEIHIINGKEYSNSDLLFFIQTNY